MSWCGRIRCFRRKRSPTCTPRRLRVLLDHLPHDSPLAASVGPEWWWQQDTHAHLLAAQIDALNTLITSTALAPMALGAKGQDVSKVLDGVKPWRRPYEPPKPKPTFEQKVNALMSLLVGR